MALPENYTLGAIALESSRIFNCVGAQSLKRSLAARNNRRCLVRIAALIAASVN
jgi:hypothetical protein